MTRGLINIGIGLLAIIVGLAISIGSYEAVRTSGGHYFITWGIVLIGIWRLVVGIVQLLRSAASKQGRQAIFGFVWPRTGLGWAIRLGILAVIGAAAWLFAPESWKSFSPGPLRSFQASDDIRTLSFSPDGEWLAAATGYGGLRIWNRVSGAPGLLPDTGPYVDVEAIAFAPDGHAIAAATSSGLRIWTSPDWGHVKPTLLTQANIGAYAVAFAPDGKTVVTGSVSKGVLAFDAQTGAEKWTSKGTTSIDGVAFSRDGRIVASGEESGDIKLWDAQTGALLKTLHIAGMWMEVSTLTFFKDGRLAAGSYRTPGVTIWDTAKGTLLRTLRGTASMIWPPGNVWSIAVSPDDKWIAAAQSDGSVRLWTGDAEAPAKNLFGHAKDAMSVAFAPDGQLASGGADKRVNLWPAP